MVAYERKNGLNVFLAKENLIWREIDYLQGSSKQKTSLKGALDSRMQF